MSKKRKFPKIARDFNIPIYGGCVFACNTREQMAQLRKFFDLDTDVVSDEAGFCSQIDHEKGSFYILGWFNGQRSTLVHECGHLAMYILDRAGIDARHDDGEAYCYLLGYLVEKMGINK